MRLITLAIATLVALGLAGTTCAQTTPALTPFTVKIIGFNDFHGNLVSPGTFGQNTSIPAASRPPVGGAAYLAGHIAKLKAANPLNVVVGAGDFVGATPLLSAAFNDEPTIEALNRIGLEFNAVGNHEFDKGAAELLRLQNGGCKTLASSDAIDPTSCKGALAGTPVPFEGAKFKWLSANVVSSATGRTLLPPYGIKSFNGVKVAFIGMTFKATPTVVTPTGVAGLTFKDEADTVNALVPRLRAQGIEAIVVLVHQGGFQGAGFSDINGCDGNLAGAEIAQVVSAPARRGGPGDQRPHPCGLQLLGEHRGRAQRRRRGGQLCAAHRPAQCQRAVDPGHQRQRLRPRHHRRGCDPGPSVS